MSDQEEYLEEITRVNNQLVNVTRELAKKNAELERSKRIEIENARLLEGRIFSGAIAHMMNNIMTNISLAVDLIENEQQLDNDGKAQTGTIRNEIRRVSELVDRLLLVTHEREESREPFELDALVRETVAHVPSGSISIEVVYGAAGRFAYADGELVRIALEEIVTNAVEASLESESSRLSVETRVVDDDASLLVAVTDNGPGISADIADSIFAPFVTSRFLGRGLGLALAKQAIEACNGNLSWSRVDNFTTFVVMIPAFVD